MRNAHCAIFQPVEKYFNNDLEKYDWYDGNLVEKFMSGALWHGRILNSQCAYTENCVFKIHQS